MNLEIENRENDIQRFNDTVDAFLEYLTDEDWKDRARFQEKYQKRYQELIDLSKELLDKKWLEEFDWCYDSITLPSKWEPIKADANYNEFLEIMKKSYNLFFKTFSNETRWAINYEDANFYAEQINWKSKLTKKEQKEITNSTAVAIKHLKEIEKKFDKFYLKFEKNFYNEKDLNFASLRDYKKELRNLQLESFKVAKLNHSEELKPMINGLGLKLFKSYREISDLQNLDMLNTWPQTPKTRSFELEFSLKVYKNHDLVNLMEFPICDYELSFSHGTFNVRDDVYLVKHEYQTRVLEDKLFNDIKRKYNQIKTFEKKNHLEPKWESVLAVKKKWDRLIDFKTIKDKSFDKAQAVVKTLTPEELNHLKEQHQLANGTKKMTDLILEFNKNKQLEKNNKKVKEIEIERER